MILLKEVRLKNFLSHSDTQLNFEAGSKKLLDGVSGAGKSSIIDALLWGLYGKGRTDNRSLIKRGAEAVGVQILLTEGDKEYRIERQYSKAGKQNLDIAEKVGDKYVPIKIVGIKFMQEHIETKILKSSYLLFINSIAYPQDNQENFVKQTAEKRKDIILEIIKASDYDVYYDKAKDAVKNLEVKCAGLEVEEANAASNLQASKTWVDAIPGLEQAIKDRKGALLYANTTVQALERKKEDQDKIIQKRFELNTQHNSLNQSCVENKKKKEFNLLSLTQYESLDLKPLQEKVELLAQWRSQVASMEVDREKVIAWDRNKMSLSAPLIYDWQPRINDLIAKANKIATEPVKVCSNASCPYAATIKEDQEARIDEINKEIAGHLATQKQQAEDEKKYQASLVALGDRPAFDETAYQTAKSNVYTLTPYEAELGKYANITADIARLQAENKAIDVVISDLEAKMVAVLQELSPLPLVNDISLDDDLRRARSQALDVQLDLQKQELQLEEALRIQKQNAILEQKLVDIKKQLSVFSGDRTALDLIKDALGNKGVKSIIIDYVIPQLEDKINEVLSKLSDFRVALETQKEGVGGDTIIDGLFITITNGQGETFDLASYSGGEKMRITTAISEGLASLQKTGFRVFDESIVGLDAATVEGFTEILMQIQANFSQVICVSHLQPIKDLFEEKITVVKKGGDSFIQ